MLSSYIEARIKHIQGNLSPALFSWHHLDISERSPRQIKYDYKEALGEPVATYTIDYPNHLHQKCYLFKHEAKHGRKEHSYTMLEYTKRSMKTVAYG